MQRSCVGAFSVFVLMVFVAPSAVAAGAPNFATAYVKPNDVKPAFVGLPAPKVTPQSISQLSLTACGKAGQSAATSVEVRDTSAGQSGATPAASDLTQAFYLFPSAAAAKAAVGEIAQIAKACTSVYTLNGKVVQGQGPLPIGRYGDASASLGTEFQLTPTPAIAQTKSFFIARGPIVTNVIVTSSKDLKKAPVKQWAKTIDSRLAKVKAT